MKKISRAENFQSWIDQLKAYQKKAPDLFNENVKKSDSKFRIEHYFDIFNYLELEKGWLVDYLYLKESLGGEPVIIAYPESKREKYKKIIDKIEKTKPDRSSRIDDSKNIIDIFFEYDDVDNYLKHVILDESEESYFQFLILALLGSQFSLFWHAGYNDGEFVCTLNAAEKIIDRIGREGEDPDSIENRVFDQQSIKEVRKIDFEPVINIEDDKVLIRLVYFTKWGGFIRGKYEVEKSFPHKISKKEGNRLVKYDCGYVY